MAIVATATACGFYLRRTLCSRFKLDFRMGTILAATISTVIGTSGYVFQIGETPNVALATSILYLVPGIPYINSLSNLLNGMFLGCISQFFKGAILTICLSLGFCIGLVLTNLHLFSPGSKRTPIRFNAITTTARVQSRFEFYKNEEAQKEVRESFKQVATQMAMFKSLGNVYSSLYYIDLKTDSYVELVSLPSARTLFGNSGGVFPGFKKNPYKI